MRIRDRRPRSRVRRLARQIRLGAEVLEGRQLLVTTPINVASGLTFALALPLPGLATGTGMASTAQTLPTVVVTVAPSSVDAPISPTPTGPSTTLSPLPNDFESAMAPSSEVARPTPGRSDRISTLLIMPEISLIEHLRSPGAVEVIPGPEIESRPPAPVAPAQPPAEPTLPLRPVDPPPAPARAPIPDESNKAMNFEFWDAAMNFVATDLSEDSPVSLTDRTHLALAAGALFAAWGGWKYRSRFEGRSRRRPLTISVVA